MHQELFEVIVQVRGPRGAAMIGTLASLAATHAELEEALAREAVALELADRVGATPPDGWGHDYLTALVRSSPLFGPGERALLEAIADPACRDPRIKWARRAVRAALDRLEAGEPGAGRVARWPYGR